MIYKNQKLVSNKTVLIFLIILIFSFIDIHSQSGGAQSLEPENRWIYFYDAGPGNNYYTYKEILGDTIINITRYAIVKENEYYSYQRADSDKVYYFNLQDSTENISLDYSLNIGDTLMPDFYVINKGSINIWGKTLRKICIRNSYIFYWKDLWYTEWIGLTSGDGHSPGLFYDITLLAAIIENNFYGDTTLLDIDYDLEVKPDDFTLHQNYPNPFNPSTLINYSVPQLSFVTLKVYDLLGREVATLVDEEKSTGAYVFEFDGSNLSSGVYFYRMQAGNFSDTKKFILLR